MVPSLGRSDPIDHAEIAATKRSICFLLPPLFERDIFVSVCGDLLNVFLQESFPSQSLVLGYVNEFVCLFCQREALGFSFHAVL